ncbi:hypothetical protein PIB30_011175 [Stylosanthes scabra]|uniref:Uncharacterized protein n=1 Tax=Stylosanthes scabra TaxID=79078 RepID=A0ABU6R4P1_9FABA|nr:hypothetical protein [Stylosanthes scabra]
MAETFRYIKVQYKQETHFKLLSQWKHLVSNLNTPWCKARNGAPAPCPSRARALDVNFVIKQRVARPRHLGRAAARSQQNFIWTIIHCCGALVVNFPMALEPSRLDLCSSSYDQHNDRRSGLTAL